MTTEVLRLAPERGRVGKRRQVPSVDITPERLQGPGASLDQLVPHLFHRYTEHGSYASPGPWVPPCKIFLYCDKTDTRIATIHITKETIE